MAALWNRVPATLYFDGIVWWLSHCRYKSVWVVFLNTDVFRLPSSSGVTRMSRKGIDPSSLTASQVNFILGCMEFRCCRKLSLLFFLMIVNVSSTYLFHRVGGVEDVLMTDVLIQMFCVKPHPICEADGTYLCFCVGMGH